MVPVQHPLNSEPLLWVTLEASLDELLGGLGHLAPLGCGRGKVYWGPCYPCIMLRIPGS